MNAWRRAEAYLRASWALKSFNVEGCPLLPKSLFSLPLYNRGAYNEFLTWIHSLHLDSADWVVDVGANHGDFAEAVSAYFPNASVLLVEPLSQLHDELQRRSDHRYGKWEVEKCALGFEDAVLPLHVAAGQDAVGSLAGFAPEYQKVNPQSVIEQVPCKVRPLDAITAERNISRVDLLKIDVEGFEFEVLKGAARTLERTRALILETSLVRRSSNTGNPLIAMLDLLTSRGFWLIDVVPSLFDPVCSWKPVEFNILARRPDDAG